MSKNDQNAASYVLVLMHTFRICFKKVLEQLYIKKKKKVRTKQVALKTSEYAIYLISTETDGVGLDLTSIVFNK